VFNNLGFWELGGLILLALFIFGPERLPKVIGDGMRLLRNLRSMARNATDDLSRELGTEVRLEDLHPKTFIRKHLISEDEERDLRRPFDDAYRDVRQIAADTNELGSRPTSGPPNQPWLDDDQERRGHNAAHRYDSDAT
jgi:sec-independent protein translocase protein TatB